MPTELVAASCASLRTIERQLGDKALKPVDLTVRQYIAAPQTIRDLAGLQRICGVIDL